MTYPYEKGSDEDVIFSVSVAGEGGVIKSICRYLMRFDLHKGMSEVIEHRQQIADLRETLGGAEAEIQRLHHRIGVEEQRTSRSITDWASAGYPLLLERAEKAEAELQKTLSMLDKANVTIGRLVLGGEVVEQALTDVRAVVGETLGAKS